jgi:hypothetical protein
MGIRITPEYRTLPPRFDPFSLLLRTGAFAHHRNSMDISTQQEGAECGFVAERRDTSRFPLQQEVKYRLIHSATEISGFGKTLNFGSGGILFTTEQRLPMGRTVELAVDWPARLGGVCPLQFVAVGRVIRSEPGQAAVRIQRYEFKTRANRTAFGAPASAA